jgi:hypothetical protein
MEYIAPALGNDGESSFNTPDVQGHYSEGGPLPYYLLTDKFNETADTYNPYDVHDYMRRELADQRGDTPIFESDFATDTRLHGASKIAARTGGTRSGADIFDVYRPEECIGVNRERDTRPAGAPIPQWKVAQSMARSANEYLRPTARNPSHMSEASVGDNSDERLPYRRLVAARERAREWHLFDRSIVNDRIGRPTRMIAADAQGRLIERERPTEWRPIDAAMRRTVRDGPRGVLNQSDAYNDDYIAPRPMRDDDGAKRMAIITPQDAYHVGHDDARRAAEMAAATILVSHINIDRMRYAAQMALELSSSERGNLRSIDTQMKSDINRTHTITPQRMGDGPVTRSVTFDRDDATVVDYVPDVSDVRWHNRYAYAAEIADVSRRNGGNEIDRDEVRESLSARGANIAPTMSQRDHTAEFARDIISQDDDLRANTYVRARASRAPTSMQRSQMSRELGIAQDAISARDVRDAHIGARGVPRNAYELRSQAVYDAFVPNALSDRVQNRDSNIRTVTAYARRAPCDTFGENDIAHSAIEGIHKPGAVRIGKFARTVAK